MNAQEAQTRAQKYFDNSYQSNIDYAHQQIVSACEDGFFYTTVDFNYAPRRVIKSVVKVLREEGFYVRGKPFGTSYTVKWGK